ncbi:MAG: hypothetical protein E6J75_05550 [Deltaproteobacteria bacterium]|nr:MAG: hypothetical protein E6J75_05550 [Deltaproteobacteria bacterium]
MPPFFRRDELERNVIVGRALVRLTEKRRRAGLVAVLVYWFGIFQKHLAEPDPQLLPIPRDGCDSGGVT